MQLPADGWPSVYAVMSPEKYSSPRTAETMAPASAVRTRRVHIPASTIPTVGGSMGRLRGVPRERVRVAVDHADVGVEWDGEARCLCECLLWPPAASGRNVRVAWEGNAGQETRSAARERVPMSVQSVSTHLEEPSGSVRGSHPPAGGDPCELLAARSSVRDLEFSSLRRRKVARRLREDAPSWRGGRGLGLRDNRTTGESH